MNDNQEFNLASANKYEMKEYAKVNLNLALGLNMSESTMRKRIFEHCTKNNLEVPNAAAERLDIGLKDNPKQKTVTINISSERGVGGNEPVMVVIQGFMRSLPRGIDIKVTESVAEVLRNAVQDVVTQEPDGELIHTPAQTYPFSVVSVN